MLFSASFLFHFPHDKYMKVFKEDEYECFTFEKNKSGSIWLKIFAFGIFPISVIILLLFQYSFIFNINLLLNSIFMFIGLVISVFMLFYIITLFVTKCDKGYKTLLISSLIIDFFLLSMWEVFYFYCPVYLLLSEFMIGILIGSLFASFLVITQLIERDVEIEKKMDIDVIYGKIYGISVYLFIILGLILWIVAIIF